MQQTEQYQFNLVETGDAFSPAPLNENMEKVEAALGSGGKTCRVASGSYVGIGEYGTADALRLDVDFKPLVVCLAAANGLQQITMIRPATTAMGPNGDACKVVWEDKGVSWYSTTSPSNHMNVADREYHWHAFGISE